MKRIPIIDPHFELKEAMKSVKEESQVKWELMSESVDDSLLYDRIKVFYPKKIKDLNKVIDILYMKIEKGE